MKIFNGRVVADQMNKTVVVEVTRMWTHPLYQKTVKRTKKYLVHDENEEAKVNDVVSFTTSRPISKRKHFRLVAVDQKAKEATGTKA